MPHTPYTSEETAGKALIVTQSDLDAINAALPEGTEVAAMWIGGTGYIGADLLTDCGPGGNYEEACDLLHDLEPMVDMPPRPPDPDA